MHARTPRWRGFGLALLLLTASPLPFAQAQPSGERFVAGLLERAGEALEAGRPVPGLDSLLVLVEARPTLALPGQPSALSLLARALQQADRHADAYAVLSRVVTHLAAEQHLAALPPDALDLFLTAALEAGDDAATLLATTVYLDWLSRAEVSASDPALAMRVRAAQLVHPDTPPFEKKPERADLTRLPGSALAAWWRRSDPLLATPANEAVAEHLERYEYARARYTNGEGDLDARAQVFLRYGAPSNQTRIHFDDRRFVEIVIEGTLTLNRSDFPDGEFWSYDHLGPQAQFVFTNRTGTFLIGEVIDLVPSSLKTFSASQRGQDQAGSFVRTLELIYRQISLHHPDYAQRYAETARFGVLLDEQRIVERADNGLAGQQSVGLSEEAQDQLGDVAQRLDDAASAATGGAGLPGSSYSANSASLFAATFANTARAEDAYLSQQREEQLPELFLPQDETPPLPVLARTARFLDDDGTTRVLLDWTLASGALEGVSGSYVLAETVHLLGPAYRARADYEPLRDQLRLDVVPDGIETRIPPQTTLIEGIVPGGEAAHLAAQWSLIPVESQGDAERFGTVRADSLRALDPNPAALLLSDLRPRIVPEGGLLGEALPYPFGTIRPDIALALEFEVYHLTFGGAGDSDETRYSLEVEVTQRGRRRLFRRGEATRSAVTTERTGTSRTARELILVDLSDAEPGAALTIRLRVRDALSGQATERTIRFDAR